MRLGHVRDVLRESITPSINMTYTLETVDSIGLHGPFGVLLIIRFAVVRKDRSGIRAVTSDYFGTSIISRTRNFHVPGNANEINRAALI